MWWATTAACGNRTQTSLWPYPVRVVAECLSLNELDLATCTAVPAWSQRGKRKRAGGEGGWLCRDVARNRSGQMGQYWSAGGVGGSADENRRLDRVKYVSYNTGQILYCRYTVNRLRYHILDDWLQTNNVCSHWYCLKIAAVIADEIRDLREFESLIYKKIHWNCILVVNFLKQRN